MIKNIVYFGNIINHTQKIFQFKGYMESKGEIKGCEFPSTNNSQLFTRYLQQLQ